VVALHGLLSTRETWKQLVPLCADRELWLFDLKGHGASPCPHDGCYSVRDQAALVLRHIHRHDLRDLTLVGHSFGGSVALLVSIALMKEGSERLSSLVLIDSLVMPGMLPRSVRILRALWPVASAWAFLFGLPKKIAAGIVRSIVAAICEHPENIQPAALASYARNLRQGQVQAMIQTVRTLVPVHFRGIEEKLGTIDVPTLIVWGREDPLLDCEAARAQLQSEIRCARFMLVNDCGHIPHEEHPEKVLPDIAAFLRLQLTDGHPVAGTCST
jgi:pimeloyl-ACP methyl ester carboxylesterase